MRNNEMKKLEKVMVIISWCLVAIEIGFQIYVLFDFEGAKPMDSKTHQVV
jgi:hypothetical protein